MKTKMQNLAVSRLVCRECRALIPTSQDVAKAIIAAVEHEVRSSHRSHTVAMTLYGTRDGVPLKHTIAV